MLENGALYIYLKYFVIIVLNLLFLMVDPSRQRH